MALSQYLAYKYKIKNHSTKAGPKYDGKTYHVYEGFGHEGLIRSGDRNDLIVVTSIKFSSIFTN